jgi:translation elongation factor EF-G
VLLEPIMKVEVVTPEEYTGWAIGDLNSRRGHIQGQDMRGNANVITAIVPLANMFGYVNTLRSMSHEAVAVTTEVLDAAYNELQDTGEPDVVAGTHRHANYGRGKTWRA